ncbi:MAG: hypothetical protein JEY96_00860 [Bacteroidales bacterium]|nr:hypothetical protein [Bacteroidales bacterium]
METEIIELIDTSIKIGLGAIIASFSSYMITRYNHKADTQKEFFRRYIDTIESITDSAERYYQKWTGFRSTLDGVSKKTTEVGKTPASNSWNFIDEKDDELVQARSDRMTAISRLKLLKIEDVAKCLEDSIKIENELREIVMFKRIVPSVKEVKRFSVRMSKNRTEFYNLLSCYYNAKRFTQHNK